MRSAEQVHAGASAGCFWPAIAAWLEINPLVRDRRRRAVGPRRQDDLRRQRPVSPQDLAELRDLAEEEPAEVRAGEAGLSYVQARRQHRLPGQRRRAGHEHDGPDQAARRRSRPTSSTSAAGPTSQQVTEAFRILLADKNVQGGAGQHLRRHHALHDDRHGASWKPTSCVGFNVPLVVRLEGTEVEEGRKILAESELDIIARRRADRRREEGRRGGRARESRVSRARTLSSQRPSDSP